MWCACNKSSLFSKNAHFAQSDITGTKTVTAAFTENRVYILTTLRAFSCDNMEIEVAAITIAFILLHSRSKSEREAAATS